MKHEHHAPDEARRGVGYLLSRLSLIAGAALVPLVALQAVSIADARREAEHRAFGSLKARADAVAQHGFELLSQAEHLMAFLAARQRFRDLDVEACQTLVDGVAATSKLYRNIGLVAVDGRLVCSSAPSRPGTQFLDFPWFRDGLAAEGLHVSAATRGTYSGRMVVYLTMPVVSPSGRRAGLIAAALDLAPLNEQLQAMVREPGTAVALVQAGPRFLTRHPDPDQWMGRPVPAGVVDAPQLAEVPVRVAAGPDGTVRAFAETPLPRYGITAYAGMPADRVYAAANAEAVHRLFVTAMAVGIGLLAAWLAARRLAEALRSIADTARRLQAGHTDIRADTALPGEFGEVAVEFNRLMDLGDERAAQLHRSEQHAVRLRRFYEALSAVGRAIARQARAADLAVEACRACVEAGLAGHAWYAEVGHDGRLVCRHDEPGEPGEPDGGAWHGGFEAFGGRALEAQRPLHEDGGDGTHAIAVPVVVEGAPAGVLMLRTQDDGAVADDELMALLQVLGDEIALGLNIDRHREARAALASAEAANRAKTSFLSHVSHELRTPLNAMLGFAQLLQARADEQRRIDDLADLVHVLAAGRQLTVLIDELMDVSRIEAGELTVEIGDVDLARKLRGVVQLNRPLAARHGVDAAVDEALPEEGLRLRTDPRRLHQVLMNLVSNAVKYNRPGGHVRVAVQARADEVAIRVEDSGVGMSPAQVERLFQSFDRLGREHSGVEGTGIGLVISRRLVGLLGGRLVVDSEEGTGTTVTVWLPYVAPQDAVAPAPPPPAPAADALAGVSGLVLYIEDNPVNALLVQQCFARTPAVEIAIAPTGNEGLRLAAARQPALVLLDMQLPDLHGLEVLARLRGDRRTAGLRVIALSASAMPEEVEAATRAGAEAYWTKPVDFAALRAGVARVLREAAPPV